jgi:hypothetical protein
MIEMDSAFCCSPQKSGTWTPVNRSNYFVMNEARDQETRQAARPANISLQRTTSFGCSSFRYYIHDAVASCRLQLIGELTEAEVAELNGCWRTVKTTLGTRKLILDLHALRNVDEAGKQWLAGMAQEGAACSPEGFLRDLVAGKHTLGVDTPSPAPKPGLFSRILGLLRCMGVEAAK